MTIDPNTDHTTTRSTTQPWCLADVEAAEEAENARTMALHIVRWRWQHPILGLLYPDRFIPLAERTDVIDALTRWVLTHALQETADLGMPVAVNVSARNLVRPDFADHRCPAPHYHNI